MSIQEVEDCIPVDLNSLVTTPSPPSVFGFLRILLAEDNSANRRVTPKMLSKLGYMADAVVNGQEVLQALERQPYDLILMDVKMPVMNGIEAARVIRERWPNNGPGIIAITAYALYGDKEKCLAAGMNDYVSKPVKMDDLETLLRNITNKKSNRRTPQQAAGHVRAVYQLAEF